MTKILLVEDDKSLREIYGVRLLAEGYDIVSAGDGEEALAMAIKDRPQLIVSDVMMPKISGFDMLDILRSTTETKDIKVIMMTALSSEDQRARGEQLGADRYLVKSQVGIEDVVRTVHEVLGDAPTSGAAQPTFAPAQRPATPNVPPRQPEAPAQAAQPAQNSMPPVYAGATSPAVSSAAPTSGVLPTPPPAGAPQPTDAAQLPQPTAPFSTTRPSGLGLSDRVINPLPKQESTGPDISTLMEQELSTSQPSAAPVADEPQKPETIEQQPAVAPAPAAQAQPTTPTPNDAQPLAPTTPQPGAPTANDDSSSFTLPTPPPVPSPTPSPAPTQAAPSPSTNPFVTPTPNDVPTSGIEFEETPRPSANQTPPSHPNTNPFLQQ